MKERVGELDFDLTEDQRVFQRTVRRFVDSRLVPIAQEAEREHKCPRLAFELFGEMGYIGAAYPEEFGGMGADKVMECIWIEESSRIASGLTAALMVQAGLATSLIHHHGSQPQKEKYLRPALAGRLVGAFALTEPDAGSDVLGIRGMARKDEHGYEITASKMFITNAPIADYFIVALYTDREKKSNGMSVFVVDRDTPGLTVNKLEKLGNHSAETGEVIFDCCRVQADSLVGQEGRGFQYVMECLDSGRISHGARSLGIAQAALDVALRYAKERIQFGKPIGGFQAIQFKLARMATALDNSRLQVYRAAWLYSKGGSVTREAAMAKLVASEAATYVTAEAMHILGGYGYTTEYPAERYFRDAKLAPITEGTSEIQQMVIARALGL